MFCPKCAAQNADGAHFCRVCGANVSLVSQAMSGRLPLENEDHPSDAEGRIRKRDNRYCGLDQAFRNGFMGLGFVFVALALSMTVGRGWWFWMLIPGFAMMGTGIAQFIRYREKQQREAFKQPGMMQSPPFQPAVQPANVNAFPRRNTGELRPPPSVTEGTTRHLGAEAATRHLDAANELKS